MRIRPAVVRDKSFILGLAHRLVEFGPVPGRDAAQMIARDRAVLADALESTTSDSAVFIAEDERGSLGFIHLTTTDDYYTGGVAAHVADVVVRPDAGGRGVGSALLTYAEGWAREQGLSLLTLNVFVQNEAAREVYRRRGWREEWIRCVKRVQHTAEPVRQ